MWNLHGAIYVLWMMSFCYCKQVGQSQLAHGDLVSIKQDSTHERYKWPLSLPCPIITDFYGVTFSVTKGTDHVDDSLQLSTSGLLTRHPLHLSEFPFHKFLSLHWRKLNEDPWSEKRVSLWHNDCFSLLGIFVFIFKDVKGSCQWDLKIVHALPFPEAETLNRLTETLDSSFPKTPAGRPCSCLSCLSGGGSQ